MLEGGSQMQQRAASGPVCSRGQRMLLYGGDQGMRNISVGDLKATTLGAVTMATASGPLPWQPRRGSAPWQPRWGPVPWQPRWGPVPWQPRWVVTMALSYHARWGSLPGKPKIGSRTSAIHFLVCGSAGYPEPHTFEMLTFSLNSQFSMIWSRVT